ELAEPDREVHHRRPQPFEAALGQGRRLEHVGRADADALIALDAALEELALLHRAWRADGLGAEAALVHRGGEPEGRIGQHAAEHGEGPAATGHGRSRLHRLGDLRDDRLAEERGLSLLRLTDDEVLELDRSQAEGQRVLGAVVDAVEADEALALPER